MLSIDQTPALVSGTGASVTTLPFTTAVANEIIIAIVTGDGFFTGGSGSFTVTDSGAHTWTQIGLKGDGTGGAIAQAFYTTVSAIQSNLTVTATTNVDTGDTISLQVITLSGYNPTTHIGAVVTSGFTSGAVSNSLTTLTSNSLVFAVYANSAFSPSLPSTTATGSGQTLISKKTSTGSHGGSAFWRTTTPVAPAGSTTLNLTTPSSGYGVMLLFEIEELSPIVQSLTATGGENFTTTHFPKTVIPGNSILVAIGINVGVPSVSSVADNAGNTYSLVTSGKNGAGIHVDFWLATNVASTGSPTQTLTIVTGSNVGTTILVACEVSGLVATPFDQVASGSGFTAAISTGNTPTTTQGNEILFMAAVESGVRPFTAGNGFTMVDSLTASSNGVALEYQEVNATGAYQGTMSMDSSATWAAQLITLKTGGGSSNYISLSSQYVVKASHSITESLQYTIKTLPSALTKSLQYKVRETIPLMKQLQYATKSSPIALLKSLQYGIANAGKLTKSLQYTIRHPALAVTKSFQYTIKKTQAAITRQVAYIIAIQTTLTKSLAYSVKASVLSLTKALRYFIPPTVTGGGGFGAMYFGQTAYGQPSTLSTISSMVIIKGMKYTVKAGTKVMLSLAYAITITHPLTKALQYGTVNNHALTKTLQYTARKSTALTKSLKYAVPRTVTAMTKTLIYSIKSQPTITKTLTYLVPTSQAVTKAMQYAIRLTQTAIQKSLKYTTTATASALTKDILYKVVSAKSITKDMRYLTTSTASAVTKALRYYLPPPLGGGGGFGATYFGETAYGQASTKYGVVSTTITKTMRYAIAKATSLMKPLNYQIKQSPAQITKSLRYLVESSTGITKSLRYVAFSAQSISKTARYTILGSLVVSKSMSYITLAGRVVLQKTTQYTILRTFSLTKAMQYITAAQISLQKSAKYTVTATKSIQKTANYFIKVGNYIYYYIKKNTAFSGGYSNQNTSYNSKYSDQATTYTDNQTAQNTTYTDAQPSQDTPYTEKY